MKVAGESVYNRPLLSQRRPEEVYQKLLPHPPTGITGGGLWTPSLSVGSVLGQGWSSQHQVASSTPPSPDLHLSQLKGSWGRGVCILI